MLHRLRWRSVNPAGAVGLGSGLAGAWTAATGGISAASFSTPRPSGGRHSSQAAIWYATATGAAVAQGPWPLPLEPWKLSAGLSTPTAPLPDRGRDNFASLHAGFSDGSTPATIIGAGLRAQCPLIWVRIYLAYLSLAGYARWWRDRLACLLLCAFGFCDPFGVIIGQVRNPSGRPLVFFADIKNQSREIPASAELRGVPRMGVY